MADIGAAISFVLDDLAVDGTHRFTTEDLKAAAVSAELLSTCSLLADRLRFYHPKVQKAKEGATLSEIYNCVEALSPMFRVESLDGDMGSFRLLHFLCTQLQSARLTAHNVEGDSRRAAAGKKGKIIFQLDKICKDMQVLPEVENPNEVDVINAVRAKLTQVLNGIPKDLLSNPPKALGEKISLKNDQKEMMEKIADAYHADFLLRRQMLIKRLDVTIQSFLWGEQAQGKEGEIVAAIQAQRKHLQAEPTRYSYSDAQEAPLSLLHEHSKRVTDQSGKSLVKTVIIGSVPDRGGRANEMRPKARDMGFGGGRGGGSGRGGGGGRGGGRGGHERKKGGGGGSKNKQK